MSCDRHRRSGREIARLGTTTREILEGGFFLIIFSDAEDEFACFATSHRRIDRVARTIEYRVCLGEFSISRMPRSRHWRSETIEPESDGESLEYGDRSIWSECSIIESFHDTESDTFTDK
jgi:hypothetical protein